MIDRQFKLARAEGREEPLEAYAFDALIELADSPAPPGTDRRPRPDNDVPNQRTNEAEAEADTREASRDHPYRLRSAGPGCGRG